MTQEAVATAIGISLKGYQRFEAGNHNPTLDTIGRIATALGLPVGAFFATGTAGHDEVELDGHGKTGGPQGWRVHSELQDRSRDIEVFSAVAVAGTSAVAAPTRRLGWATPPDGRHLNPEGLFVLQVMGSSMVPLVEDGQWILLRRPAQWPWLGKVVLCQFVEPYGDGQVGRWWLKRIGSLEAPPEGGIRARLESLAKGIPPIILNAADESELSFIAEIVEVIGAIERYPRRS